MAYAAHHQDVQIPPNQAILQRKPTAAASNSAAPRSSVEPPLLTSAPSAPRGNVAYKDTVSASDATQDLNQLEDIYIAIMGVTGAGKSKFIELCTQQKVELGHGLESCTREVDEYVFTVANKYHVHLIDTPGFDDTNRSDREVLDDIARWMGTAYLQQIKLSGLIYIHRIIDPRLGGAGLRNLLMFKKLCGEDCFARIMLTTSMWDLVDEQKGIQREEELLGTERFWGQMKAKGSTVARHDGTRQSALRILQTIIKRRQTAVLAVQREMVDEHRTLDETGAGRAVNEELVRQREKFEREIKQMQADREELIKMNELKAAESLATQQKQYEARIQRTYEDQKKLQITLEQLQLQRKAEIEEMERMMAEAREALKTREEELAAMKENYSTMDPNSGDAEALRAKINATQADIEDQHIKTEEQAIKVERKKKNLFLRSWAWVKANPTAIASMSISLVLGAIRIAVASN